jgi:hypothetical protein
MVNKTIKNAIRHVFNKESNFKDLKCHPSQNKTKKKRTLSCLTKSVVNSMKNMWNKRYPDSKIQSETVSEIKNELKMKLKDSCNNEMCWIDKTFDSGVKNKIKKKLFAPKTPETWKRNINEWLSSSDILNVMQQYEDAYRNFKFFGPAPIDFNSEIYNGKCVWPEICNINIKKLIKGGYDNLGFIFNTDKHYQSGSHWIALYVDIKRKVIFFFDSNGTPQCYEISELISSIKSQCLKLNIKLKEMNNHGFTHQYSNTECGMYCLYFIVSILTRKNNFNYFKTKRIPDKKVEEFRNIYFNMI